MERFSESLSVALRKARGERSQAEFARFLGFEHQATYQRYEQGRIPDADILYQMANRLGVTMEELLAGGKDLQLREGENIREECEVWKRRAQDAEQQLANLRGGLRSLLELTNPNPLPEPTAKNIGPDEAAARLGEAAVREVENPGIIYGRKKK